MSPTPPIASSKASEEQFRVRKRNRTALSCGPCRFRKLRCDRALPCDNCMKRGEIEGCTYAFPSLHKKNTASTMNSTTNGTVSEMQNRIDRLEGLVLSLIPGATPSIISGAGDSSFTSAARSTKSHSWLPPVTSQDDLNKDETEESDLDRITKSVGKMILVEDSTVFIPPTHWYTIIGEINEVKQWFVEHSMQFQDVTERFKAKKPDEEPVGASSVFFQSPRSEAEMLWEFPTKPICDVLLARFFEAGTLDPAYNIIHRSTFQKQYDAHWQFPARTPLMWLGLVYAMMAIALQSFEAAGDEPPECRGQLGQMIHKYKRLTAHAITMADDIEPHQHVIETLLLYVLGELGRSRDIRLGVLHEVGLMVRLSMIMGYHCDPQPYTEFTPFGGEMRRRVWCAVRQADLLVASRFGFQPIIRSESTNTELPSNLYDDELHEGMEVLPPSRPMTESTPMCYTIFKSKLLSVFAQIWEGMQLKANHSFDTAMELDKRLHETHADMPAHFKMRPMEESLRDPPQLVVQRYALNILFLCTQCILHRRFISFPKEDSKYMYSKRTAIEASVTILQHQATLYSESGPGGRLSGIKWLNTSLVTHDFLLGAMIVSLELYDIAKSELTGRLASTDVSEAVREDRSRKMAALERSRQIWGSFCEQSRDARKAYGMLTAMLGFVRSSNSRRGNQQDHAQQATSVVAQQRSTNGLEFGATGLAKAQMSGQGSFGNATRPRSATEAFNSFHTASHSATFAQHLPTSSTMSSTPAGSADFAPQSFPSSIENESSISNSSGNPICPNPFDMFDNTCMTFPNSTDIPGSTDINWDLWSSMYADNLFPVNGVDRQPFLNGGGGGVEFSPPPTDALDNSLDNM